VEEEVNKIIHLKYNREFARICIQVFKKDFVKKRDELFKLKIEKLALQNSNYRDINLRIGFGLGLCKKEDFRHVKERGSIWINEYVKRNYGINLTELPKYLDPDAPKNKTIKQQIFDYMEKNPIARPIEVKNHFKNKNLEPIRYCVKEWKKINRKTILNYPRISITKYTSEMGLDNNIEKLAVKLLDSYISMIKPSLNSEWKGLIAGAIYLASIVLQKKVSQIDLTNNIGATSYTISKQYRQIAKCLNIKL
jgi:hypothetical protein